MELNALRAFATTNNNLLDLHWDMDDPETWKGITFSNCRVTEINLYYMGLTGTLDLSEFEYLTKVNVPGNQISVLLLPEESRSKIRWLNCRDNALTNLIFASGPLELLDCGGNYLDTEKIIEQIVNIKNVNYVNQKISDSAVYSNDEIAALRSILNNNEIWDLSKDFRKWYGVTWKETDGVYHVSDLDISDCSLSGSLDVSRLKYLERLECSGNSFTKLCANDCSKLSYLNCCMNSLTSLNIDGVSLELQLFCENNKLDFNCLDNINNEKALFDHQKVSAQVSSFDANEYVTLKPIAEQMGFDIQKPDTWDFVQWRQVNGKYRAISINAGESEITIDSIDFSDFEYLTKIDLHNTDIKEITFPESMIFINEYALWGCSNLSEVNFPNKLEKVGEGAFEKCSSLSVLHFPKSLINIDLYAFNECTALEKILFDGDYKGWLYDLNISEGNDPIYDSNIEFDFAYENPTSIIIDSTAVVEAGKSIKINASVIPSSSNQKIYWSYNDDDIISYLYEGVVTGSKPGYAIITVTTVNGLKATCQLRVIFQDVPVSSMYYSEPVYWAVDNGITNGYRDSDNYVRNFKPQNNCTREAVVTFLWRLAGKPQPKSMKSPFWDVQDSSNYYYKAVLWAAENGITSGYSDGSFKPYATCLREHVVTFLWRYAGKPEISVAKNPFNDVKVSDYYYKAAIWANAKGIAKGYSTGENAGGFGPKLDCLREHVVTFLYRFAK